MTNETKIELTFEHGDGVASLTEVKVGAVREQHPSSRMTEAAYTILQETGYNDFTIEDMRGTRRWSESVGEELELNFEEMLYDGPGFIYFDRYYIILVKDQGDKTWWTEAGGGDQAFSSIADAERYLWDFHVSTEHVFAKPTGAKVGGYPVVRYVCEGEDDFRVALDTLLDNLVTNEAISVRQSLEICKTLEKRNRYSGSHANGRFSIVKE